MRRLCDDSGEPGDASQYTQGKALAQQEAAGRIDRCIWHVRIAPIAAPDRRSVLRFRPDALPDSLRGDDRIDLDKVLPGFELTVAQRFASLVLD